MDRGMLNDATSSDDNPTPGYMLSEISRATLANYQANTQVQDFLISRLGNKNHNVKFKCLVIIKHICRTGRPEFKREMTRKVDPIKECLQFRGPPDPLRGDEPYRKVRDAAKEALDAIFDSQMPVTTSAVSAANRIQGMGNDYVPETKPQSTSVLSSIYSTVQSKIMGDGDSGYVGNHGAAGSLSDTGRQGSGGGYGGSSYGGPTGGSYGGPSGGLNNSSGSNKFNNSGMTGIGNPNFRDAREEKSWLQTASEMATTAINTAAPILKGGSSDAPTFAGRGNGDYNYATNRGNNAYGASNEGYNTKTLNAFSSNAAGAWSQQTSALPVTAGGNIVPDIPGGPLGSGRAGAAASDGQYEKNLIDSLCEPGGLRPVPAEDKLQQFLTAAATLSPDVVGNCLLDSLNNDSWQSRTKALLVISSLAKALPQHQEWWVNNAGEVRALTSDNKAGVRTQAAKTLKQLTGENSVVADDGRGRSISPVPSANTRTESLLDVFDGGDDLPKASPPPVPSNSIPISSPAVAPQSSSNQMDSLFAGMSLSSSPVPSSMVYSPSAASAPVPLPPAAAPVQSAVDNAFDFLDMGSPPPALAPPVPQAASSSGFGFVSGESYSSAPSTTSIFDAMDTGSVLTPMTAASASPSSSTGFSFLNSSTSAPVPTQSTASLISSVFDDSSANKKKEADAFGQLGASFNNNSASTSGPGGPARSVGGGYIPATGAPSQPYQYPPNFTGQPRGAPMAGGPMPGAAPMAGGPMPVYGQSQNMGYPPMGQPHMFYPNQNVSPVAPGMLSHSAPRKDIPTADNFGGNNSGFSFMGSSAPPRPGQQQQDSFNFVSDAMKGMK